MRLATLCALLVLVSCSSTEKTRGPTQPTTASPLGAGYPHPEHMLTEIVGRMEARDFHGLCAHLAGPGRSGRPVPLIPGKNLPDVPKGDGSVWPEMGDIQGLRAFLGAPWKDVQWQRPVSLLNDPPVISVPVRVDYAFDRIPEAERQMMIRTWSKQRGRTLAYADVVEEVKREESGTTRNLTFAYLENTWRLYLGPPLR